jgi:hypothetical protein
MGLDVPQILGQLACIAVAIVVAVLIVGSMFQVATGSKASETDDSADQELCTHCGYDVRGLVRCPECGSDTRAGRRERLTKLREDWPTESFAPRVPGPEEQPVVILTTDDSWAASLLKQHLEARGIAAQTVRSNDLYGAVYTVARTSYRLTVWSDDEERGRAILEHLWPAEARESM